MRSEAISNAKLAVIALAALFRSVARSSRIALRDCRARWWGRIAKDRIDGLLDEPRPGRPRRIQDDQVAAVIERMLATTPPGATHRSIRSMVR